ncbi:hypothetical protein A3D77_05035 [Candidatus Gottesmanbacteria bacterium RIFCSPHIGHO2_02_FULL_39_11]|uniref:Septum formation initiator n=1 Tax=Candidatus Gottesmanbacteria bacterium RIFCSPHIGHO2_02_FULL_39_11 TaxID=1798382 RepID=A0A1F5ZLT3_9BACT|nr:MAG: hypothetical protein A3D77_05035 [Candidatus Gottesmanbacteria bacterium RIFCSPHIGHO2_02_FULL_39_11]
MSVKYRVVTIFLSVLCLVLVVNLIRSSLRLGSKGDILSETENKMDDIRQKRDDLIRKLAGVKSSVFMEKQAREKLNLSKKGEIVLIMPQISPITTPTPIPPDTRPNIQKWADVFLKIEE